MARAGKHCCFQQFAVCTVPHDTSNKDASFGIDPEHIARWGAERMTNGPQSTIRTVFLLTPCPHFQTGLQITSQSLATKTTNTRREFTCNNQQTRPQHGMPEGPSCLFPRLLGKRHKSCCFQQFAACTVPHDTSNKDASFGS
jgi:hypothetical protein